MQKQVSTSHTNIAKTCNNIAKNFNEQKKIQAENIYLFSEIFANSCPSAANFKRCFFTRTILSHSRSSPSKQNTIKVLKTNGLCLLFLFFHANTTLDLMLISHMHATHLPPVANSWIGPQCSQSRFEIAKNTYRKVTSIM